MIAVPLAVSARWLTWANRGLQGVVDLADGRLLLGFRNPITDGKALVVPIENPKEVVMGKKAQIGMPLEIMLNSRRIRSIEFHSDRNFIVAGPHDDVGVFCAVHLVGTTGART